MTKKMVSRKIIYRYVGIVFVLTLAVIGSQATVGIYNEGQKQVSNPISEPFYNTDKPPIKASSILSTVPIQSSKVGTPQITISPPLPSWRELPLYVSSDNSAGLFAGISGDARIQRISKTPIAEWVGDWTSDISASVHSYVSAASLVGAVPVLVVYNIPSRDCNSYSAGGASTPAAYNEWVRRVATAIADKTAIVILEPDALAGMDCLSALKQDERISMLTQALIDLKSNANTYVYVDAGNPGWQSAATMAARLNKVNITKADGFSLNISNFRTSETNKEYGNKISTLTKGKHYLIDTSRNGKGVPTNEDWCNPSGMALGTLPTTQTGNSLADAYLWLKVPGESDGTCGSSIGGSQPPAAGIFWPEYASMLAQNAGWR